MIVVKHEVIAHATPMNTQDKALWMGMVSSDGFQAVDCHIPQAYTAATST